MKITGEESARLKKTCNELVAFVAKTVDTPFEYELVLEETGWDTIRFITHSDARAEYYTVELVRPAIAPEDPKDTAFPEERHAVYDDADRLLVVQHAPG